MCNFAELEIILKRLNKFKKKDITILHCISSYPAEKRNLNLNLIDKISNNFNCKVGYSGHETGLSVSYAAAMMGISSLERHITLDRSMYGTDQSASVEPNGMRILISNINDMLLALGEAKVGHILKEEIAIAKKLRSHIKKRN